MTTNAGRTSPTLAAARQATCGVQRDLAFTLLAAMAISVGPGCSFVALDTGRTHWHSYRGVLDNDLAITPAQELSQFTLNAPVAGPAGPPVPQAGAAAPLAQVPPANGPTQQANAPVTLSQPAALAKPVTGPLNLTWSAGPEAAGAKPVNVFGEVDGQPRPPARAAGHAGFQQHTFTDEGGDADVKTDPAGKLLVFSSTRHSDHPDIYVQRVDGTAVTQLTSDAADDAYPCFSADGKQVAFASTRAGSWQIYVMDADGRNVVQVTQGTMQCIHPTFSPDGARVAYAAIGSRSNQWELWVANLQTGEKRMIGYGLFPSWSPDKAVDRIAFQKARQRGGRWFSLWTLDLIEGEGRRLTEVAASTNAAIVSPTWSPTGQRLAFATVVAPRDGALAEKGEAKDPKAHGQQDIWSVDADGGNRQRLTDGNGTNLSPCWSADNRIYFVSDRGGKECVWSVRADGARAADVAAGRQKAAPAAPQDAGANAAGDPLEDGN